MRTLGVAATVAAAMATLGTACGGPPPIGDPGATTGGGGGASLPATNDGTGAGGATGSGGSGAGGARTGTGGAPQLTPSDTLELRQELMARWNDAAASVATGFDFSWTAFDKFPHPTFKDLGSAAAYGGFAQVLLAFFQRGDDFEFLARNRLFTRHLVYALPTSTGVDTTFQDLAHFFSAPNSHGNQSASTRAALAEYATRIDAVVSGLAVDDRPAPTPDAGATPDPAGTYATWCRHYCETLHETNVYYCVASGRSADECTSVAPPTDLCFDLRCAPMRVTPALCTQQCDGVRSSYDAVCGSANTAPPPTDSGLCPSPPAEHDRACRAACPAAG